MTSIPNQDPPSNTHATDHSGGAKVPEGEPTRNRTTNQPSILGSASVSALAILGTAMAGSLAIEGAELPKYDSGGFETLSSSCTSVGNTEACTRVEYKDGQVRAMATYFGNKQLTLSPYPRIEQANQVVSLDSISLTDQDGNVVEQSTAGGHNVFGPVQFSTIPAACPSIGTVLTAKAKVLLFSDGAWHPLETSTTVTFDKFCAPVQEPVQPPVQNASRDFGGSGLGF